MHRTNHYQMSVSADRPGRQNVGKATQIGAIPITRDRCRGIYAVRQPRARCGDPRNVAPGSAVTGMDTAFHEGLAHVPGKRRSPQTTAASTATRFRVHNDDFPSRPKRQMTDQRQINSDKAVLMAGFARLDVVALGVAVGTVCAIGLFLMTAFLLIKGAPPGVDIGTHLGLLGIYLPGYTVSWGGALLGAAYAWIIGALMGFFWGALWNLSHYLYILLVVVRSHWWRLLGD